MIKSKVGLPTSQKDNIFQYLSNHLPDNRPIKSLQVIESYEKWVWKDKNKEKSIRRVLTEKWVEEFFKFHLNVRV